MHALIDHAHHLRSDARPLATRTRPSSLRPVAPRALPTVPARPDRSAPSLRLAAALWVVGLLLVVTAVGSALLTIVGLTLLTLGTAIVGLGARGAEQRWHRDRRRRARPRSA